MFRLESIQAPLKVDFDQARGVIERKLRVALDRQSLDAYFRDLLRDSAAEYHPEHLQGRLPEGDPLLSRSSRAGSLEEVLAGWQALRFERQRLEAAGGRVLQGACGASASYDWEGRRLGLDARPDVAATLASAESRVLAQWAPRPRASALLLGMRGNEAALSDLLRGHRKQFAPASGDRLRLLTRRYPGDRVPFAAFDQLAKVAQELRTGARGTSLRGPRGSPTARRASKAGT